MYTLVGNPSPLILLVSSIWEKQTPREVVPQISEDNGHGPHPTLLSSWSIRVIFYCSLHYTVHHTVAALFSWNVLSFRVCSKNSYLVFKIPFPCTFLAVTFPDAQTEHFLLWAPIHFFHIPRVNCQKPVWFLPCTVSSWRSAIDLCAPKPHPGTWQSDNCSVWWKKEFWSYFI